MTAWPSEPPRSRQRGRSPWVERRAWLAARHRPWRAMTLDECLDAATARHPERPYVLTDGGTWSYREVAARSWRLASGLARLGVEPGARVAVGLPNGPQRVALEFAIARAGAVSVQLGDRWTPREDREMVERTGARLVVDAACVGDLDQGGGPGPAAILAARRRAGAGPSSPAAVFAVAHESGRTSGVLLRHEQLLLSAFGSAYTRAFEDGRRILFALPLSHVFAYVEGMLAALFAGGGVVPRAAFDADDTLEAIARHRASGALFVPAMTAAVLARVDERHDVSTLRAVMSAGAPAPESLWPELRAALDVESVSDGYGQTETSGSSTLSEPTDTDALLHETVGLPKRAPWGPLFEYRAADPDTGHPLPSGAEGELWVRGPAVTSGYDADDALTADALRDGWFRSGDLGRVRPDGYVELTGRRKLLVRTGGENVAPREVERMLRRHPAVADACLVGVPDARLGEVLVAWLVPDGGAELDAADVRAHCRALLARFKVPRRLIPISTLPRDAGGEPDRRRLTEMAAASTG